MQISAILDNIDRHGLSLPMFQRGYVWTRPRVKKLMQSLYSGFPIGGLLIWETRAENADIRGAQQVSASGSISLLLDGQQRVTSLYGVMRGTSPLFFDGDANAFKDLYFHLETQEFEFHSVVKMALDTRWVDVTALFKDGGVGSKIRELDRSNAYTDKQLNDYQERALKIVNIRNSDLPVQQVTGEDKTTDVVVEIFNQVNSGGRKLSNGDLALARIGAQWPEARDEMQDRLSKWEGMGFKADRDWLLRCVTAVVADSSDYGELKDKPVAEIQRILGDIEPVIDRLLEAARTYLGMDTDKVHNSKQAFPVMVKYLVDNGGDFPNDVAKAKLLHWYVNCSIWGRFSGTTATIINRDLGALKSADAIAALQYNLRQDVGDRVVEPDHFNFNRVNTRLYPLLHIMSRVWGARDWGTGRVLPDHEASENTALELHHIFPKRVLREAGVSTNDVNNAGNLAFQTKGTNQGITDREPEDYMQEVIERQPGALESQWVPDDPELRSVDRYHDFLAQRRKLLAENANEFLRSLGSGILPTPAAWTASAELDPDEEEAILDDLNSFVVAHGLPVGELGYEIVDENGELVATLDLAWPNGLEDGLSEKVTVLIDEDNSVRIAANARGFHQIFTSPEEFKHYVSQNILDIEDEIEVAAD